MHVTILPELITTSSATSHDEYREEGSENQAVDSRRSAENEIDEPNRHQNADNVRNDACRNRLPCLRDAHGTEVDREDVERCLAASHHHRNHPANEGIRSVRFDDFRHDTEPATA